MNIPSKYFNKIWYSIVNLLYSHHNWIVLTWINLTTFDIIYFPPKFFLFFIQKKTKKILPEHLFRKDVYQILEWIDVKFRGFLINA